MRFSLKWKAIVMIVAIIVLVGGVSMLSCSKIIRDIIRAEYTAESSSLSRTMAAIVDVERLERVRDAALAIYDQTAEKVRSDARGTPAHDTYLANYASIEESEDFLFLREQLRRIQDVNDVDCIYLFCTVPQDACLIYLVDGAYDNICHPGEIDAFSELDMAVIGNPARGFPPEITHTEEYGWRVATGAPVFGADGRVAGYVGVDRMMNDIMARQRSFQLITTGALLAIMAVVSVVGILLVERVLVKPINVLSQAAVGYYAGGQKVEQLRFGELGIRSKDEIGALADSMAHMERDIDEHIAELRRTTAAMLQAQQRAEQMDQAASRDPLTMIRNKRAFDMDVERLNAMIISGQAEFGLAMVDLNNLKEINDTYGHENGDISIKTLCRMICTVFKRSPVYRVGGDEFVVVLEKADLKRRETLIGQFNDGIRAAGQDADRPPWERVSAAIGCAVFDAVRDVSVEAVLKRADAAMYDRKRAMKCEQA